MKTQYDFIIVDGSSAGSVLATRLSEVTHYEVLLIETGSDDKSPAIHIPA
ncbi:GMC family oxidoreductase N-terminal domain-containing protein [Psychrobium sp. 1_MG-2023]|nr:GMC family oxidoreductase N-terminal domain-containing protein [Psychrobium sp. 1_MG-2023]MDP2559749.1 GMC family oxidoreductase N-terminal domain-containing protein [Psychrobium sp. 1_MG-2023]